MTEKFDSIPSEWFGDPIRIWQAQIMGEKKFEDCSFMGLLNDLQGFPNWRDAFEGIETCTGMPEFLDRLQRHFDLCQPAQNSDGSFHIYQSPSRTHENADFDAAEILELAKRTLETCILAFIRNDMEDRANELASYPIVWTDQPMDYFSLPWKERQIAIDRPKEFHIYEGWDFEYYEQDYWLNRFRDGVPDIVGDLEEAAYSLANDFGLQRYLMQSFVTHGLDVNAQYELEWVNNCIFYFYDGRCFVAKRPTK